MTVGAMDLPPEGMLLGGVSLAGDPEKGTPSTEGLSLLFTSAGITVQGPQPGTERLLAWSGLDTAACCEQQQQPDGSSAFLLVLTASGQTVRFILSPTQVSPGQAAYLDQALPAWLQRYKAGDGASSAPAAGVTGAAAATAAGATVAATGASSSPFAPPAPAAAPPTPPAPAAAPPTPPAPAAAPPTPPAPAAAPAPAVTPPVAAAAAAGAAVAASTAPPAPSGFTAPAAPAPPVTGGPVPPPAPPAPPAPGVAAATGAPLVPGPETSPNWEPSIDPSTGEAVWADPLADPGQADASGKKKRLDRKAKKALAAEAAVAAAAATEAAAFGPGAGAAASSGAVDPMSGIAPTAPAAPPAPPAPPVGDPNAPPQAFAVDSGLPGSFGDESPESAPKSGSKRTMVVLLVVLVLIVAGIGVYFATKKSSSTTATTATTSAPANTGTNATPTTKGPIRSVAADTALAASINLRLSDLPTGWTASGSASTTTTSTLPSPTESQANTKATAGFATCLGMPLAVIRGLFNSQVQPDQTANATSPTFTAPGDTTITMQSATTVVKSAADAQQDTAAFQKPNFTTCFGQFETIEAGADIPGATVTVSAVALSAPTGVMTYAYLSTATSNGSTVAIEGDAFIIGGRIEATLSPQTAGEPVPSAAFTQAYNAVVGRVAAASSK